MENLPTPPQVKRNNSWSLRLEVAPSSKGCIMAPISIIRFLSEKMSIEIGYRVKALREGVGADLKVVDPIVFIVILINVVRSF